MNSKLCEKLKSSNFKSLYSILKELQVRKKDCGSKVTLVDELELKVLLPCIVESLETSENSQNLLLLRSLSILLPNSGPICVEFPRLHSQILRIINENLSKPGRESIIRNCLSIIGHLCFNVGSKMPLQVYSDFFKVIIKYLQNCLCQKPIQSWKSIGYALRSLNIIIGETKQVLHSGNMGDICRLVYEHLKTSSIPNTRFTEESSSDLSEVEVSSLISTVSVGQESMIVAELNVIASLSANPNSFIAYLDLFILSDDSLFVFTRQTHFSQKLRVHAFNTIRLIFENCKRFFSIATPPTCQRHHAANFTSHSEKLGNIIMESFNHFDILIAKWSRINGENSNLIQAGLDSLQLLFEIAPLDRLIADPSFEKTIVRIYAHLVELIGKRVNMLDSMACLSQLFQRYPKDLCINKIGIYEMLHSIICDEENQNDIVKVGALNCLASINFVANNIEIIDKLTSLINNQMSHIPNQSEKYQLGMCNILKSLAPSIARTDISWWIKFAHVYAYQYFVQSIFENVKAFACSLYSLIPESVTSKSEFANSIVFCLSILTPLDSHYSPLVLEECCKSVGVLIVHPAFQSLFKTRPIVEEQVFEFLKTCCAVVGSDDLYARATWAIANICDVSSNLSLQNEVFEYVIENLLKRHSEKMNVNLLRIFANFLEQSDCLNEKEKISSFVYKCMNSNVPKVQWNACRVIKRLNEPRILDCLLNKLLLSKNTKVRISALQSVLDIYEMLNQEQIQQLSTNLQFARQMNVRSLSQTEQYEELISKLTEVISTLSA